MHELLAVAATSFIVGFSGACTPGPLLFSVIVHSSERGFRAGPLNVLGHFVVEGSLAAALVAGLAALVAEDLVKAVIGLVGGALLLFMGVDILRYSRVASMERLSEGRGSGLRRWGPVVMGAVTSVSNPFFILWWVSVGNSLLLMGIQAAGLIGAAAVYLAHISSDLVWYSLVSLSVGAGRKLITDPVYKAILAVCGALLTILSLQFIYAGAKVLIG